MTLRITKTNVSGFTATQEEVVNQTYVNSAYEFLDAFSIDLVFEGVYPDAVDPLILTYQNAINVTSTFDWASIGLTFSKPNAYTVRLTGPGTNVFPGQFYKFKMVDLSEQVLQADTTEPFLSLIQYKMPSPTYTMKTYPFVATIPPDLILGGSPTVENVDMKQWFYWRYQVATANIASIRARGLK
jgi:hypothetical protein